MTLSGNTLRQVPTFQNVPEDQLDWLVQNSELIQLADGEYLFQKGDPIDKLYVILDGGLEIKIQRANAFQTVGRVGPFEITGYLPFSRATTAIGLGEVVKAGQFLIFPKSLMKELATTHYELTEALVHKMTSRTRELTQSTLQNEKLMALGKLSAGLAHELNNPAAAMVSSAKELKKHLGAVPDKFKKVVSLSMQEEEVDAINDILFGRISAKPARLSAMERSDLEEEVEEFLEEKGIEEAYRFSETLAEYNFGKEVLNAFFESTNSENFPPALQWVENVLSTEKIVDEISEAAQRIASLITSIKTYSHMDRAQEKTPMDIEKNIGNTLTILNHKLKTKSIQVELSFAPDLPHPQVMVGEVNQVWTNIIDNAIHALAKNGTIKIKGEQKGECIFVSISDNGIGIPPENISKIFDPFFTTKKVGEGTGLGLDVTYRIVKQHQGDIEVTSDGNGTTFTISLPLKQN